MTWDLKELRDLIKEIHGENQLNLANAHINSVVSRIQISRYHLLEAKETIEQLFHKSEDKVLDASIACFTPNTEQGWELNKAQLKAEANLIGCAQSTHSVADIMAYAILYSLKISGIDDLNLSLKDIQKHLVKSNLKDEVIKLLGLNEFSYLKDFVNTTKHRSLVTSTHYFNNSENNHLDHALKLNSFSYQRNKHTKPRSHPEKGYYQFFEELQLINEQYVRIGQFVNHYLSCNP